MLKRLPNAAAATRPRQLRFSSDRDPGFTRRRAGRGFAYLDSRSRRPVASRAQLARIRGLVIPPAWRHVWICKSPRGHLQATGMDARGRKQYLYHPRWGEARNELKFQRLAAFGEALPRMRGRIERDLRRRGHAREKVIACVVHMLDRTMVRIGNDEYARTNKSYGLTTMRNHHVRVRGDTISLRFKGKSGSLVEQSMTDPRIARIVRRCQDLPGQELFEYIDDEGRSRDVTSSDINEYLARIAGASFTAKDFRTWGGTVEAARTLADGGPPGRSSRRGLQQAEIAAVRAASELLGNTMATCRKFYVHPGLIDAYARGSLARAFRRSGTRRAARGLTASERALLRLLPDL